MHLFFQCAESIKEWILCQLEVLECRKVPWPNAGLAEKYGIQDFNWPNKESAYECKINLLTGRTHQVHDRSLGFLLHFPDTFQRV